MTIALFNRPKADAVEAVEAVEAVQDEPSQNAIDKEAAVTTDDKAPDGESDGTSSDAQAGVKAIEATTSVWARRDLVLAYMFIWAVYFMDAMQQTTTGSLTPYVTSSFYEHSLTATTSVMSSLIGGIFQLPLAKILDIWGRPQGFALMTFLLLVGLVMMAVCQNVQTYAAAQVFYWVGYNGVGFSMSVFIADTSQLKNRAFAFAFVSSPYIATAWIGGPLATAILSGPGSRWGFGIFAICEFVVTLSLFILFYLNYRKAKKAGLLPERTHNRSFFESLKYYAIEFDVVGLLLIAAGLALFLLPFSLYSKQAKGWQSPIILSMLVVGIVLLFCFIMWEKHLAPKTFIPFGLLMDRTVLGACILAATIFIEFYIWNSYFFSFLQVVNGLNITQATYVANIYTIGSCFFSLVVGVFIRWHGRFKNLALLFGVPLTILGVGLMIAFRQPSVNISYIIMCQVFIAFSGGTLVICEQMAVMAAASHQQIAVVLAVESMFASIGGAIGSTVAGAIWTGVFPVRLMEYLPTESQGNFTEIYGDLTMQMSYPAGSTTRDAINRAYGDAQRYMLIAAACILILSIGSVVVWRDYKVKEIKQVKGRAF